MSTATSSGAHLLAENPEIMRWVSGIEIAAGSDAWVDIQIDKRNGRLNTIRVTCVMKLKDHAGQDG